MSQMTTTPAARAANDFAYAQELARRERSATDRMRNPGPLPMSQPHDWSGFDSAFRPRDPFIKYGGDPEPASRGGSTTAWMGQQGAPFTPPKSFDYAANAVAAGGQRMLAPSQPNDFTPALARNQMQNLSSPGIQQMLDAAAGVKPGALPTGYGTASVRFDKGNAGPAADIKDAQGGVVGVGRAQPFDLQSARSSLYAAYPQIFRDGTPENKAFVDHVTKYGEQSAHQNISDIMQPFDRDRANAAQQIAAGSPSAAAVRSSDYAPGSGDQAVAQRATQKVLDDQQKPGLLARAANAVMGMPGTANPNPTANTAGSFVPDAGSGLKAIGSAVQNASNSAGQFVRNLFTPKAPDFPPAGQPGGRIGGTGTPDFGRGGAQAWVPPTGVQPEQDDKDKDKTAQNRQPFSF